MADAEEELRTSRCYFRDYRNDYLDKVVADRKDPDHAGNIQTHVDNGSMFNTLLVSISLPLVRPPEMDQTNGSGVEAMERRAIRKMQCIVQRIRPEYGIP